MKNKVWWLVSALFFIMGILTGLFWPDVVGVCLIFGLIFISLMI